MDGSHMGKVIFGIPIKISGIAVPIKYFQNLTFKIFSYIGLTKTNLVSNSLTERVRQV
jgi:hypothetical protein